ncbi:MAG: PAS domain S-box protein [Variovorax sp.]
MSSFLRRLGRSLVVLVVGLGVAAGAGLWQAKDNEARSKTRFDAVTRRAIEQVAARMHVYEYGLRGARGAVIAAGGETGITRLGFAQYSASRDVDREFPGSRGFGFVRRVPVDQEAAFIAAARLDGKPDFALQQLGSNDGDRYVVQYAEPADRNGPGFGLDIASEPNRRAAADRAMLSGEATLTAPITLAQENRPVRAFLLLLPVYRIDAQLARFQQRFREPMAPEVARAQTFGWVLTPLAIDEVLKGFDFQDGAFSLALADITRADQPERFFVSRGSASAAAGARMTASPLQLFGRVWQVEVTAQPLFATQLNLRDPWAVFAAGVVLAAVLSLLSYVYLVTRRRQELADEQRSRLAAIVTSSNDAIIGRRLDGTITDWNAAAAHIFGYTSEEAVGKALPDLLVPAAYEPEETEMLRQVAQGQSVAAFETFRRHRGGAMVAVSVAAAPIRAADGRVVGDAQTVRDITHENANKAHILELNAMLEQQVSERTAQVLALSTRERAILTGAGSAIIATDVKGVVTLFNPAAEALLGYAASEVVNRVEMNRFHDAHEVHARATARSAELGRPLAPGEVFEPAAGAGLGAASEWTYVRKDGTRVPVHLNVSALYDGEANVVGFIAIAADLSERKLAEEKMRNNERIMRIVTDNIPGVVAYWTPDMRCTFANNAHQRWMGRSPAQMIGITHMELIGAEQFSKNEPFIRTALAGQEQRIERTRTLADGSTVHYWLHYIPDRDGDVVKGFISVAVDVTEMKRAQTQLENLNLALNERRDQAESASKAKSEFLANMSHEIRSPLNAVIGLTYLLRQTPLDARQQSFLQKIDAAGNSLLGVINDILDISKIEAGEMALDESEFGLRELLRDVTAMMTVNANHRGIALRLEATEDLPARVRGDVTRIRQILVNLLSNAIKFTAQGAVRLSVHAQEHIGDRLRLRFTVTDTGIGIEADVLARLFRPFTQADTSTTRRFGGTGLGLSIVKQLAELMGGELGVSSTPGRGSEFWVVLPLEVAADGVVRPSALGALVDDAPWSTPTEQRLASVRVLVVDDSPVNLEVCQHILEREGAQVALANNGLEAVELLRSTPVAFDLVLMDVQMPMLDGNEATRLIRRELGLTLPVIALTASALVAERERAFEAGMDDFVSKPFDVEALIRCVRGYADRAQGRRVPSVAEAGADVVHLPMGWPSIEGIDAADAVKRLGGDVPLLRSVLRRLLAEFGDLARVSAASSKSESSTALSARLHKLHGSAGMIGAKAVGQLAADAQAALKSGERGRADPMLRALSGELHKLQMAAKPFLDTEDGSAAGGVAAFAAGAATAVQLDPEDLALFIDSLRKQSLGAMALFDELAASLKVSLGGDRFESLHRAMQDLQFKRAIELLQEPA